LKIPSTVIRGDILIKKKVSMNSLFDDDFDPFAFMQGFGRMQPFAMTTQEVVLDVQPAVAGVSPWLPAMSLEIVETWDDAQQKQVGEALSRTFQIVAEGVNSNQLPSLNEGQMNSSFFKVYADKPELFDEIKNGIIKSSRKESFTIIPQKAGLLTLPEISIAWWDVTKKEKVVTTIPSRTLQILPAFNNTQGNLENRENSSSEINVSSSLTTPILSPLIYGSIAGLALLLVVAICWGIVLQRRMARLLKPEKNEKITENHQKKRLKPSKSGKNEKLPDLNPT
jgi:hypothetical protein